MAWSGLFWLLSNSGTIFNSVSNIRGTVNLIRDEFSYLSSYDSNINKMNEEADKLADLRESVEVAVEAAKRNLQNIRRDVTSWMEEADGILTRAFEYDKVWCIDWLCPNVMERYSLSKRSTKVILDIAELHRRGQFTSVSYPLHQAIDTTIFPTSSKGLDSRIELSRKIIEALKDDTVQLVGLCGLGGVGKTRMAQEIWQKAKQKAELCFDEVVLVTVTRAPDMRRVQQSIANCLGLELKENDIFFMARTLRTLLKQRGHVLLILDDVWMPLDLFELGLPFEASEDNKRCKVFFTSRNLDACYRMKPQKVFEIVGLPPAEAWNLFQQEANECFAPDHDLYQVARDIVQRCEGLPLAIVTIAKSLSGENDRDTWQDILVRLNSSDLDDEYSTVYKILAESYNFIRSDETKRVFLLCCLFPEDEEIAIEDLLRFGIGLNLFARSSTVNSARNRTYACVNKLKNNRLLDGGSVKGFVKMHGLVRDTGLNIVSTGENIFVVRHGDEVVRWPEERKPECCTSISLRCHKMLQLPGGLKYPQLELLQLIGFRRPLMFPTNFFEGMGKLQVLDLKGMLIQSYPFEVSKRLRSLSLDFCTFPINVSPLIGNLGALTILSFVFSDIKILPQEIGKLVLLRVLDLTGCGDLHTIAPGVLESLIHLEELYMRGCNQLNKECLWELSSLSLLAALEIEGQSKNLPRLQVLPKVEKEKKRKHKLDEKKCEEKKCEDSRMADWYPQRALREPVYYPLPDIAYGKLTRFRICAGHAIYSKVFENTLMLFNEIFTEEGIEVLFGRAEILYLSNCRFQSLQATRPCLNKSEAEDFSKMRALTLDCCDWLVHVVQRYEREPSNVFQILESLLLCDMPYLEDIFSFKCGEIRELNGPVQLPSFQNLCDLEIRNCPRLKKLFWISKGLMKLQNLKIVNCVSMEAIFWIQRRGEEVENAVMNVDFPELKCLVLVDLPYVTEICEGVHSVTFPRLIKLQLENLPKLTTLHFQEASPNAGKEYLANGNQLFLSGKIVLGRQLEGLSIDGIHLKGIQTDEHLDRGVLNLRRMSLTDCDGLATVVSSHVIQKLMFLKVIKIEECPTVEVVFDLEGMIVEEAPTVAVMNSLTKLELDSLPCMTHVWKHAPKGFEGFKNLAEISLEDCKSLGPSLFSPLIVKLLVQLQHLRVSRCDKMEVIVKEDDEADPVATVLPYKLEFPSLTFLRLEHLRMLSCFCSEPCDFMWPSLKVVDIINCPQLKSFTVGNSFTPLLSKINIDKGVDLNTAVEDHFKQSHGNPSTSIASTSSESTTFNSLLTRSTERLAGKGFP